VYLAGGLDVARKTLMWVDRAGRAAPVSGERHMFTSARLSPDERTIAVAFQGASSDIWLLDVARGVFSRFTYGGSEDWHPIWTPDGRRVVYSTGKALAFPQPFWKPLKGAAGEERLTTVDETAVFPTSWSPDGRDLLVTVAVPGTADVSILAVGGDRTLRPLVKSPYLEYGAAFSPEGQRVAYVSQESGRAEVYLMPYGKPGERRQVSPDGGRSPVWAKSGRELFYYSGRRVMVVDVASDGASVSPPRALFEGDYECAAQTDIPFCFDVTADGQRFVMIKPDDRPARSGPLSLVVDWSAELTRRAPAR
jgi:Tol biopolymer transport system component